MSSNWTNAHDTGNSRPVQGQYKTSLNDNILHDSLSLTCWGSGWICSNVSLNGFPFTETEVANWKKTGMYEIKSQHLNTSVDHYRCFVLKLNFLSFQNVESTLKMKWCLMHQYRTKNYFRIIHRSLRMGSLYYYKGNPALSTLQQHI